MKNNRLKWVLSLVWLFQFWALSAQIRIEVEAYPPFLTPNRQLFIAGTFNDWNPGSVDYELKRTLDGTYFIDLPDSLRRFEYKFTQGNWMLVEGDSMGSLRTNHVFDAAKMPETRHVKVQILSWERKPTYNFVVKKLPENTPHDATLYIAGNFNNWNPKSTQHRFYKQSDGTFRATVVSELDTLEFKFTRGNWASVEGWVNGKVRPNRKFYRYAQSGNNDRDIDIEIESWEDLTGTFHVFTLYDLMLFFAALQGLLFILIIPNIKRDNREANRWLMALMALTSFAFFLKILCNHREIAEEYPKIILLPDVVFFVYAPLFFLYLNKLLFHTEGLPRGWWRHVVLPVAQLFVYLPYFLMDDRSFSLKVITRESQTLAVFNAVALVGLAVNVFYWWQSRRALLFYDKLHNTHISDENHVSYFHKILAIQMLCLLFWLFSAVLSAFDIFFGSDIPMLIIRSVDATWLVFSMGVYFLGYYALMQPQVVNVAQTMETPPNFVAQDLPLSPVSFYKNDVNSDLTTDLDVKSDDIPKEALAKTPIGTGEGSKLPEEMLLKLKLRLEDFVGREKPYSNPNLSLNDLAMKVKMQPHVLSKVINQGFDKNFFDFINSYRVDEFKKRMDNPAFKNYTIISIAYDVGFNSKTAFNRAFKKLTNQTPSQFYNLKNDI